MMLSMLAASCMMLGASFEVNSIGLTSKESKVNIVNLDDGPGGDILIIDGLRLTAYNGRTLEQVSTVTLEAGTTCFDVADITGDGRAKVIAVHGEQIVAYDFPEMGQPMAPPRELFTARSLLAIAGNEPYSRILTIPHGDTTAIALPFEHGMELRGIDGELLTTIPTREEDLEEGHANETLRSDSGSSYDIGGPEALVASLTHSRFFRPDWSGFPEPERKLSGYSWGLLWRRTEPPEEWPWFPLKTNREFGPVALVAASGLEMMESVVRIASIPPESESVGFRPDIENIGRQRRYSGQALLTYQLPDFNNDGYTDLVLWRTPLPGLSTDALTRALSTGMWGVDVTVHLYDPQNERFEPAPSASLHCLVPATRFLNFPESPLDHVVLLDFDGDGRTDFACSTVHNRFAISLYGDNGFPRTPDFERAFPGGFYIVFSGDFDETGRAVVMLRTDDALYVIRTND